MEVLKIRAALGYTLATGCVFAPFVAYLSSAQQIFQDAYQTGALFPVWFGVLALAIGGASLVNGRLVMKHGMHRLSMAATVTFTLASVAAWTVLFAFDGLPPFWLFMAYLLVVFLCFGVLFGNLNALAMEPLGHLAGVGAAVVASLSTFIAVFFGALVGQSFDGTMYVQIGAFAVFGAGTFAAMRWADTSGSARGPAPAGEPSPATRRGVRFRHHPDLAPPVCPPRRPGDGRPPSPRGPEGSRDRGASRKRAPLMARGRLRKRIPWPALVLAVCLPGCAPDYDLVIRGAPSSTAAGAGSRRRCGH